MTTVSDFLIERLHAWGVRRIFGYPGDGINGIIAAIDRFQRKHDGGGIDFVQVRHEEQAAFMACAHAKFTGELGVCLATSGPGAIHLLNGLYDAKGDHVPVLAITGQAATSAMGSEYQQEVDLQNLFKDVASEYLATVVSPVAAGVCIDRAVRAAISSRTVAALFFPKDLQEDPAVEKAPQKMNAMTSGVGNGIALARMIPPEEALREAASVLNAGSKVAMLIGAGAFGAHDEVIAVADALQAGCAKALLGKAVLSDELPWVTGTLGLLGTRASSDMMKECDTLFLIGTNYPYAQFLPEPGKAPAVQIDTTGSRLGVRYPIDVNLQGDTRSTLQALLPLLDRKTDASWRMKIAKDRDEFASVEKSRAHVDGKPINPELVFVELNRRLPDGCILTADAGTSTNWAARHLTMREGMKWSLSGGLATMGSAVPYAISAKFAFPDRVAIALTGDGAMQMNGMNGLLTVARYWKRWSDPRLIFYVAHNDDLNQVTWEMRIETGVPKYPGSQDLPPFAYAEYAKLLGFEGIRVERPDDVGPAWDAALRADRPVVLDVLVDPEISMLPPHVTPELARSFASAALHGDPNEGRMLVQSIKGVLAGVFPTHHAESHEAEKLQEQERRDR
ncbi:MAG TPA: thiamine pyrophosphate-requiring protein [Candidatus Acidoferrum sp.]|nr:thiamine pyrophosphate-requiring protein [Candidatus Acidoferrum sp.]